MSDPPRRSGAIGVIIREDGRFLVIERSVWVRAPGRLCFPGGEIETDETEQLAVIRELKEELALDVTPARRIWRSVTDNHVELFWWLAHIRAADQRPRPNPAEVAHCCWMHQHEMISDPRLLVSNQKFLQAIHSGEVHLASS